MASFAFNFLPDEATPASKSEDIVKINSHKTNDEQQEPTSKPFVWWTEAEVQDRVDKATQREMVFTEVMADNDGGSTKPLRVIDLNGKEMLEEGESTGQNNIWRTTDLEDRVYEGGMKVWEGSLDLVRYICQHKSALQLDKRSRILELGCGHALPACWLLREYYERRRLPETANETSSWTLTLTDYNDFCLQDAAIPNIVLNMASIGVTFDSEQPQGTSVGKRVAPLLRLGHGDWMDLSRQLLEQSNNVADKTFDLILAAETVYSERAAADTVTFLLRHISDEEESVALVATKRFYFGVGGGSDAFTEQAHAAGLEVSIIHTVDTGVGNIRDILQVTRPSK